MQRIGIFFGGRSVEHGVSVVTTAQVMDVLQHGDYEMVPIYLTVDGDAYLVPREMNLKDHAGLPLDPTGFEAWARKNGRPVILGAMRRKGLLFELRNMPFVGEGLRKVEIDVALPLVHGSHGEDGTLQGLFELADVAYVGSGVLGSAVCMDKAATKSILKAHGFPVVDCLAVERHEFETRRGDVEAKIGEQAFPLFVKPASLGSSIAVTKAKDVDAAMFAVEVALYYDQKCLVEPSIEGSMDINCAVLGGAEPIVSVCERPLRVGDFLTYADKYTSGGKGSGLNEAARQIPAELPAHVAGQVQALALDTYRALYCDGIVRIDFLVRPDNWAIFVNEINTVPGSLGLYLWEGSGLDPKEILGKAIAQALAKQATKRRTLYSAREASGPTSS